MNFGDCFNHDLPESLKKNTSLTSLYFGRFFNRSIKNLKKHKSIQYLGFGEGFKQPWVEIVLSMCSLVEIRISNKRRDEIEGKEREFTRKGIDIKWF